MTSVSKNNEFIKERLQRAGFTRAVVADNAFGTPSLADVTTPDLDDFLNDIEGDDELLAELGGIGFSIDHLEVGENDVVSALWATRDTGTRLVQVARATILKYILEDYESVTTIVSALKSVGMEVTTVGSPLVEVPHPVDVVFLDYFFGSWSDPNSKLVAGSIAREIYKGYDDDEPKPFIVLMSSRPEARKEADQFRQTSDLLGSLFDFVSKNAFSDVTALSIRLASWAAGSDTRHKIQRFVEALDQTWCATTLEFMQKVKSLTIEDYAHIQALSLQKDGHPFGEYMLGLYGSMLVNSVLENNGQLADKKRELDGFSVGSFIPSHKPPSRYLAEAYSLSIAEPISQEIDQHPRAGVCEGNDGLPLLRLGDLLVRNAESKVYMVATPDCDLAYAPGSQRDLDDDLAVVLIPGVLHPLNAGNPRSNIRTELFYLNGQPYRIYWEPKKIVAMEIGQFRDWYAQGGYARPVRIRLPYALEIQQAFASNLGRVGTPVAPPLPEFVDLQFYCEGENRVWTLLGETVAAGATVIHTAYGESSVEIHTDSVLELLDRIHDLVDKYRGKIRVGTEQTTQRRQKLKLNKLLDCRDNPDHLIKIIEKTWELPISKKTTNLGSDTVKLHRNRPVTDQCSDHLICLDIVYV